MTYKLFSKSHEWIEVNDKVGTVGITYYAQRELGEIVYVQLPKVGYTVKAGQEICVLESTKAAADVYSPVSGKVTAVNEAVVKEPELINRFPETQSWLFKIELSNPKELEGLLSFFDYEKLLSN
jgi:glycine cleavage system H protein